MPFTTWLGIDTARGSFQNRAVRRVSCEYRTKRKEHDKEAYTHMTGQEPTLLKSLMEGVTAYRKSDHSERLKAFRKLHFDAKETIKNHQNEGIFFQEDQTKLSTPI